MLQIYIIEITTRIKNIIDIGRSHQNIKLIDLLVKKISSPSSIFLGFVR